MTKEQRTSECRDKPIGCSLFSSRNILFQQQQKPGKTKHATWAASGLDENNSYITFGVIAINHHRL